ncbi:MAG: immunoglobulin-like domain-containing protein [Alkaliphilus sp.]
MRKKSSKCLRIFVLLFLSLVFIIGLRSVSVYASSTPTVTGYRMISTPNYITLYTIPHDVEVVVSFDSLEGIDFSNATAEINLATEGPGGVVLATVTNAVYIPNELLFNFTVHSMHFVPHNIVRDGTKPYLLKVENITLDNGTVITVDSSIDPHSDHRVYYDPFYPQYDSGSITSTGTSIGTVAGSYQNNEFLEIQLKFSEKVIVHPDSFMLNIVNFDGKGNDFTAAFTEYSGNGTNTIMLRYKIGSELRADYSGNIRVASDLAKITDLAGNKLQSSGIRYFDVGTAVIKSIYPSNFQETPSSHGARIIVRFDDDDTNYDIAHLTTNWKVGIFLSETEIIEVESIGYSDYALSWYDNNNARRSYLTKCQDGRTHDLYIRTSHSAFTKADGKDQPWYFYYFIEDADGHKVYHEIANVHLDRNPPEITITGDYLVPSQNQEISFKITDYEIHEVFIEVRDSNDNPVSRTLVLHSDSVPPVAVDFLANEIADRKLIDNTIDVAKMIAAPQYPPSTEDIDPLNTGTYKLVIQSRDSNHYDLTTEQSIFFAIDKTPPTVATKTNEGDPGTLLSYELTLSDVDGMGAARMITEIGAPPKKPITLYYEFTKVITDGVYPEAATNQQIVNDSEPIEIIIPYGDLSFGTYLLNITAVDYAGNKVVLVSADTFEVPDISAGTIICDDFSNDLPVDVIFEGAGLPHNNLEYRFSLNQADNNAWTSSWQALTHIDGAGTLTVNLDSNKIVEGTNQLYIMYRTSLNNSYIMSAVASDSFIYDIISPTATIEYSTEENTTNPVTATLVNWADNISPEANLKVRLKGDDTSDGVVTVALNAATDEFTFILTDEAGNESEFVAKAPWISSEVKPATIMHSTLGKTRDNVAVYLDFEAMDNTKAVITLLNSPTAFVSEITDSAGNRVFEFSANGNYDFQYTDDLGRTGYVTAYIRNIDRVTPTGEISYSRTKLTNKTVYGIISPSESVNYKIYDASNNLLEEKSIDVGQVIKHPFTENASITVILTDEAGNEQSYNLSVDWIDKTPPVITVEYSDNYHDSKTRNDITVTILANETINILNNNQNSTKTFTENEEYSFIVEDLAGNRVNAPVKITNIDKSEITLIFTYSTLELTNSDITVTVSSDEPFQILNNNGSPDLVFTENSAKVLKIKDTQNDITVYKLVEVTNIDKQPPVMTFDESEFLFVSVGGSIDLDKGFTIFDETDGTINEYTINHNINFNSVGVYHADYTFRDAAGNEVTVRRTVEVSSELALVINGNKGTDRVLKIFGLNFNVEIYNALGNYQLQYAEGIYKASDFKRSKQIIEEGKVTVDRSGYVTFYILDQERNWKLLIAYVFERGGK